MARLIAIAVQRLGITEVRFTGGEPLLRRGLAGLIAAAAALHPRPEISLTTNGIGSPGWPGRQATPGWTGSTCPWMPSRPRRS
jgi:molybdenum cofactor biosynthesis enzyme MoaA